MKGWIRVTGWFLDDKPLFIQIKHIVSVGVESSQGHGIRTQIYTVESDQATIVKESLAQVIELIKDATK